MFINTAYAEENTNKQTDTITLQGSEPLQKAPEPVANNWTSLVPMILIFAVFYFFLIRPQDKKRKAMQEMIAGVKKGEEVLTSSGIIGVVTKLNDNDNTVYLEVAKDVEIKMLKSAIVEITSRTKNQKKEK